MEFCTLAVKERALFCSKESVMDVTARTGELSVFFEQEMVVGLLLLC